MQRDCMEVGGTQQKAFDKLKKRFVEGPILVATNYMHPLCVESDTSDSMLCEDEKWHPCAFLSKGLNNIERNYDVHDKEMLGIIWALEAWRHYLEGAKHEIDVWTDHQNLKYFMTTKKLNCWQAHWALFLSQFNFHLTHKVGTLMKKADALSRWPDHKRGVENDNSNITLLKPEYFCICTMRQGHLLIDGLEKETLSKIRKCTDLDEEVIKALKNMKGEKKKVSEEMNGLKNRGWYYSEEKSMYRRIKSSERKLRAYIITLPYWDILDTGRRLSLWWEILVARDIKICVELCGWMWCMSEGKAFPEMLAGKLMLNPIPNVP